MRKKTKYFFCSSIALIMIHSIFLLSATNLITPGIEQISHASIEKTLYRITNHFSTYSKDHIEQDIVEIKKDSNGRIISMNYNMHKVYELASEIEENISNKFAEEEIISLKPYQLSYQKQSNNQGILILVPIGMITNTPTINNLGPKIPVVIHFMDTFLSQVKTKTTSYGMNNALMEIILCIKLKYEIIGVQNMKYEEIEYEYLIDSRIIQGEIPKWVSGSYEKIAFLEKKNRSFENLHLKN